MFIRVKKSNTRKLTAVQLVEGVRDPSTGKVKQRVVRHIGSASSDEEIKKLIELGEFIKIEIDNHTQPNLFTPETIIDLASKAKQKEEKPVNYAVDDVRNLRQEQRNIIGIHDIYGKIFDHLGFNKILTNPARKLHSGEIIRNIVLARIANPQSKRETVNFLESNYGISLKLDSVYNAMDKIDDRAINHIQENTLFAASSLFKEKIDVMFYDATTLYFESFTEDELKSKGFSKDNKFNQVQVMLSIFVTSQGIPIGYEVFPGSTYEGHTLITALANLKNRFEIDKVVFVADSGMLNKDNLDLLESHGYQYIVGARIKNMKETITEQILDNEGYESLTISEDIYSSKVIKLSEKQNLVVSYSDKRAYKDAKDRSDAIKKMIKKLKKSKDVKSMISSSGYKKYLVIDGASKIDIDVDKINEASKWDGLHGVVTNMKSVVVRDILSHYRGLWQVEETFRVSKHDLKVRPIYHWTPQKIKAHIALCFMALVCVRHLEYRVNLQKIKMSPERIRKALTSVDITLVRHIHDKRLFAIPSHPTDDAKTIYKTMNLELSQTPYLI